jgi:hypothetical protein
MKLARLSPSFTILRQVCHFLKVTSRDQFCQYSHQEDDIIIINTLMHPIKKVCLEDLK